MPADRGDRGAADPEPSPSPGAPQTRRHWLTTAAHQAVTVHQGLTVPSESRGQSSVSKRVLISAHWFSITPAASVRTRILRISEIWSRPCTHQWSLSAET